MKKIFYFFLLCVALIISNRFVEVTYWDLHTFLQNQEGRRFVPENLSDRAYILSDKAVKMFLPSH